MGRETIGPRQMAWLLAWAVFVVLLYAAGSLAGARVLAGYAATTEQLRQARLASPVLGLAVPGAGQAQAPVEVRVGIGVRRIAALALSEAAWTGDFSLWFRWQGMAVAPGRDFRVVNGEILDRERVAHAVDGDAQRAQYRVRARMSKTFDEARFPLADEVLLIEVEDVAHPWQRLRFVPDADGSHVDPDALPPNLQLRDTLAIVKQQGYRADGEVTARSRFIFAMLVESNGLGIYIKLFQALFASVAIALLALTIQPSDLDARFGLPVGAFFASVGNTAAMAPILPPTNRVALSDMVNLAAIATIFLVLVQSAISLHLHQTLGRERLARLFDKVSLGLLLAGYVAVNLVLPLAARPA